MHTLWLCAVLINHVKLTMAAPSKSQGTDSNAHHHPHHPILLLDEITNKNFTVRFGNKIKLGKLYSLILNQKENLALNMNLLDLYMLQWRCINLAPLHPPPPSIPRSPLVSHKEFSTIVIFTFNHHHHQSATVQSDHIAALTI